jgi:hypothetical protein
VLPDITLPFPGTPMRLAGASAIDIPTAFPNAIPPLALVPM